MMGNVCMGILERFEHSRIIESSGLEAREAWHGRILTVRSLLKLSDSVASGFGWQVQGHFSPALTHSFNFMLPDVPLEIRKGIFLRGLIRSQSYQLNALNDHLPGVHGLVVALTGWTL